LPDTADACSKQTNARLRELRPLSGLKPERPFVSNSAGTRRGLRGTGHETLPREKFGGLLTVEGVSTNR
jgi:hypothetical protein